MVVAWFEVAVEVDSATFLRAMNVDRVAVLSYTIRELPGIYMIVFCKVVSPRTLLDSLMPTILAMEEM